MQIADRKRYKLGDPTDKSTTTGPVISAQAVKNIAAHVADALAKGAVDATPANPTFDPLPAKGNYVAPRLLTNVNHSMLTMREETFGPIIPVMKVSSDDEAVALMNDSDYGLTASVWTKDIATGEKLLERIEAGTVYINRCDYPSPVRTLVLSMFHHSVVLTDAGSGLDRMEELWIGMYAGPAGV